MKNLKNLLLILIPLAAASSMPAAYGQSNQTPRNSAESSKASATDAKSDQSGDGTRPGFNVGSGICFPRAGFSALGEVRLHVMLEDGKPVLALPLSVGVRF